jgi:GNAT superfamily N-acetyltransferase
MIATRFATAADLDAIAGFIRKLAAYEKLSDAVRFDRDVLAHHLFGPQPRAEVLIGEVDGEPAGFALFFHSFSTFEGRPSVFLEDLFVDPGVRGSGLGRALLARLAAIALERDCRRLEWMVLDWNAPAKDFYRAIGARRTEGWEPWRVEGDALGVLAGQ